MLTNHGSLNKLSWQRLKQMTVQSSVNMLVHSKKTFVFISEKCLEGTSWPNRVGVAMLVSCGSWPSADSEGANGVPSIGGVLFRFQKSFIGHMATEVQDPEPEPAALNRRLLVVDRGLTVVMLFCCCCVLLRDAHFLPRPWPRCRDKARLLWPSPLLGSRCWVSLCWVCCICSTEIKRKKDIEGWGENVERRGRRRGEGVGEDCKQGGGQYCRGNFKTLGFIFFKLRHCIDEP